MQLLKFLIVSLIINCFMTNIKAAAIINNFIVFDYKTAKNSKTFLKFTGKSTKLGIVTTEFDGYAKKFSISYNLDQLKIDQVKIKIDSKSFDTNSQSRNEKMNSLCLASDKFPEIIGTIPNSIDLNVLDQMIVADFFILGQNRKIPMKLHLTKSDESIHFKLNGFFSLKEWNIADPSIMIAKVQDQFELEFETIIK